MPAIPVWAMRFLPHAIVLFAVLGALWYVDHRGYERAEAHYEQEKKDAEARQAEADRKQQARVQRLEQSMQTVVFQLDRQLGTRLRSLSQLETTVIQPTLTREIQRETRFSDPAAGISDGMRQAINAARAQSDPSCVTGPDGSTTCGLSAPAPAGR